MAASSSSYSSSSSSTTPFLYEVFLSFRGKDTRKNFTSHLFQALKQNGFDVFHDTMLKRCETINPQLLKAIGESRISIIVFSPNYADSRWCLDELVKINDCRKCPSHRQIVLPVFLRSVKPSDVRKQEGCYEEAFKNHVVKYGDDGRVTKWREALDEVGNLAGTHLLNDANGDEAELKSQILDEVANRLNRTYIHIGKHDVGTDSRVEELKTQLSLKADDVRVIAVWGVGGLGKTTVAKALYNSIVTKFDGSSFLLNISRVTSDHSDGLVTLQKQLISDVLKSETPSISNVDQGMEMIKRRLGSKKVLLVLDDVDHVEHFEKLVIKPNLFRPGSRIIVTTRDKSSIGVKVDAFYTPKELDGDEALRLFNWSAFGKEHSEEGYDEVSKEVVDASGRLPLVLSIWGPYMRSFETAEEWPGVLEELRKIPHRDVQRKLMPSFKSLSTEHQALFLDIACFFNGMDKDFTVKVLEDDGFSPDNGIKRLVSRSLVSIDRFGYISMHDTVRDMGREIVRQEFWEEPEKRSRLWYRKDVLEVLLDCSGTDAVQGITLDLPESNDEQVDVKAFAGMSKLRLILFKYLDLCGGTDIQFSKKLKLLWWHGFPLECMPSSLYTRNLVCINLRDSKLKQLWVGTKRMDKLRFLNLSGSSSITRTPDFSGMRSLEELVLHGCTSLEELHSSVGCLNKLVVLDLKGCISLRKLPLSIFKLKYLEDLDLSNCFTLEYEEPNCLLPASVKELSCIKRLMLAECRVCHVPHEIGSCVSLETLDLTRSVFSSLPASISNLHRLKYLFLKNCFMLEFIPDLPRNLQGVYASNCVSLKKISIASQWDKGPVMDFSNCTQLTENNFANDFRRNLLQSYQGQSAIPEINISLPGTEVPNWLNYQFMGLIQSFVAPAHVDRKIVGWIICLVTSGPLPYYEQSVDQIIYDYSIICVVHNKTKGTSYHFDAHQLADEMWLSYIPLSSHGILIDGGDEMELCFSTGIRRVKKSGLRLVYEGDERDPESNDELVIEYSPVNEFKDYDGVLLFSKDRTPPDEAILGVMDIVRQVQQSWYAEHGML